jgi:hypothetical protein
VSQAAFAARDQQRIRRSNFWCSIMPFRPDPKGARSIDEAITDLAGIAGKLLPTEPRAIRIAEMIRSLQEIKAARDATPAFRKDPGS